VEYNNVDVAFFHGRLALVEFVTRLYMFVKYARHKLIIE